MRLRGTLAGQVRIAAMQFRFALGRLVEESVGALGEADGAGAADEQGAADGDRAASRMLRVPSAFMRRRSCRSVESKDILAAKW